MSVVVDVVVTITVTGTGSDELLVIVIVVGIGVVATLLPGNGRGARNGRHGLTDSVVDGDRRIGVHCLRHVALPRGHRRVRRSVVHILVSITANVVLRTAGATGGGGMLRCVRGGGLR